MNHEIVDEIKSGDISMRIVRPEDAPLTRKYWLKAGAGHLEFDENGVDRLMEVMTELHAEYRLDDELFLTLAVPVLVGLMAFIITVLIATAVIV